MLYQVSNEWKCGFMEDFIAYSKGGYTIDSPQVKLSFDFDTDDNNLI